MSILQRSSLLPSRCMVFTIVILSVLGGSLLLGVSLWRRSPDEPFPARKPDHDPHFVTLGGAYIAQLGKAYASAWNKGANALDAGESISSAIETVAKSWSANRADLYDRFITPQFAKILPEGIRDEDVTPSERAAMAAAWRGFALGLAP